MAEIIIVGNAPYAVALESGRHLHPGEIATVEDSEHLQHLVRDRLISVAAPKPPVSRSSPAPEGDPSEKEQ